MKQQGNNDFGKKLTVKKTKGNMFNNYTIQIEESYLKLI